MDIISHYANIFPWSLYQNPTETSDENTFWDRIYTTNVGIHRLLLDIPRFSLPEQCCSKPQKSFGIQHQHTDKIFRSGL